MTAAWWTRAESTSRPPPLPKMPPISDAIATVSVTFQSSVILISTVTLSQELTALVRQSRADLKPALRHLESVLAVVHKNEDNLDRSLELMAPFYRVFANTLGTGPWFDTYIQNLPPAPQVG